MTPNCVKDVTITNNTLIASWPGVHFTNMISTQNLSVVGILMIRQSSN